MKPVDVAIKENLECFDTMLEYFKNKTELYILGTNIKGRVLQFDMNCIEDDYSDSSIVLSLEPINETYHTLSNTPGVVSISRNFDTDFVYGHNGELYDQGKLRSIEVKVRIKYLSEVPYGTEAAKLIYGKK